MNAQAHQPGEELADFTEDELLSLIDAGTAGAYSEIYRRYIDAAVARTSSSLPDADARTVADDAFLNVLRSLLNGTADTPEGLKSKVNDEIDKRLGDHEPRTDLSVQGTSANNGVQASATDSGEPDHALLAQAFSTLPDNWQRILWLRKVEQLLPEAVADRLNIRTAVVERLSNRAHQDLQKEWDRVRPKGSDVLADRRSALVPALLTSPIVIERLSDIVAQTVAVPAGSPVATTKSGNTESVSPDPGEPDAEPASGATDAHPRAEVPDTATIAAAAAVPAATAAEGAAEGTDAAVFAETEADDESPESAEGTVSDEGTGPAAGAVSDEGTVPAVPADDTEPSQPVPLAAMGAAATPAQIPAQVPAQTSVAASSQSAFSMPKPVLIPVIAACIGLLGTLVGLAIVPQHGESLRSGGGTSNVSTAHASTDEDDSSRDKRSPADNSHKGSRAPGSENSQASVPGASDRDENEESSQSSQDDAGRTGDDSPSKDSSDDNGDRPSSRNPDDPGPSDSDRPDPESPSDPTPSESESPSEPDEPETPSDTDPAPTTDPGPEPDPTTPPPSEDDTPPPDTEDPETPSDEPPEPTPSDTGPSTEPKPEPEPTADDPSTGTSTASN